MDGAKKLCHLLEERGAKYTRIDATEGTLLTVSTSDGQYFILVRDDGAGIEMWSRYFTPEQAISATAPGEDVSTLQAKVKAQSDYIDKLRGEYKALDEQMERTCTKYRDTISKLKAELDAATVGAKEMYTREECEAQFVRGFSLGCLPSGSDPQWDENRQTLDEHMAELGWMSKDAVTVGAGTCQIEERHGDWYCTCCGDMVGTCDTTSELYIDGNAIELWRHCPNCGAKVEAE